MMKKFNKNTSVMQVWLSTSQHGSSDQCLAWHDGHQQQRATSLSRHAVSGWQPEIAA